MNREISQPVMQLYIRKLAMFGSCTLGNDTYFLKEFVDLNIQDFGEENVIEMLKKDNSNNKIRLNKLGNDWQTFKRKWRKFDEILIKAKGYHDRIEKKDFSKITKEDEKQFIRSTKVIPLIKENLYALTIFFIKNSPIHRRSIPSDAWKILEYSHLKKLEVTQRKPMPLPDTSGEKTT